VFAVWVTMATAKTVGPYPLFEDGLTLTRYMKKLISGRQFYLNLQNHDGYFKIFRVGINVVWILSRLCDMILAPFITSEVSIKKLIISREQGWLVGWLAFCVWIRNIKNSGLFRIAEKSISYFLLLTGQYIENRRRFTASEAI